MIQRTSETRELRVTLRQLAMERYDNEDQMATAIKETLAKAPGGPYKTVFTGNLPGKFAINREQYLRLLDQMDRAVFPDSEQRIEPRATLTRPPQVDLEIHQGDRLVALIELKVGTKQYWQAIDDLISLQLIHESFTSGEPPIMISAVFSKTGALSPEARDSLECMSDFTPDVCCIMAPDREALED